MVLFWTLAALITLATLAALIWPLVRSRRDEAISPAIAALNIHRDHKRQIEQDYRDGEITVAERDLALADLTNRVVEEIPTVSEAPAAAPDVEPNKVPSAPTTTIATPRSAERTSWLLAAMIACVLPIAAIALYRALGNPAALNVPPASASASGLTSQQIVAMVERLAERMKANPDDPRGWALLARSYMALDRYLEAADAYAKLDALTPNDPNVLADYADALAMAQQRSLEGKPGALVERALAIDPRQKKALALAATAAADAGDYAAARDYTQRLLETLPPDSDEAKQVNAMLAELSARAGATGSDTRQAPGTSAVSGAASAATSSTSSAGASSSVGSTTASSSAGSTTANAGAGPTTTTPSVTPTAVSEAIRGTVHLKADLNSRVAPDDTVFIFARNATGPRMPLAVMRLTAKQLPTAFTLDDSMAMAPSAKLSAASSVVIEARISKTGNATPQPGDIFGRSAPVAPGARDVTVDLDTVVP